MTTHTRVVTLEEQGPPSVMKVGTAEVAGPGAGEALIRQTAIGVNYMDIDQRSGSYPLQLPSGIGLEAAGVVEAVGAAACPGFTRLFPIPDAERP